LQVKLHTAHSVFIVFKILEQCLILTQCNLETALYGMYQMKESKYSSLLNPCMLIL